MTEEELQAIEAKVEHDAYPGDDYRWEHLPVKDVRALIAEVRRLQKLNRQLRLAVVLQEPKFPDLPLGLQNEKE